MPPSRYFTLPGQQIQNIIDNWGDSDDEDDDLDEILGDGDDEEDRESDTDGPPLVGDHTALQPQQVNNDFEAEIVDTDDIEIGNNNLREQVRLSRATLEFQVFQVPT